MVKILLSVVNCWNSLDCFSGSENHFTRLGVFPYNSQDESFMHNHIKEQKSKIFIKNNDINMIMIEQAKRKRQHESLVEKVGDGLVAAFED
jgi:hypothetical protein